MHSECLPFTGIPHTTRLFADYLYAFAKVRSFYARSPQVSDWAVEEAGRLSYDEARRAQVAGILERQNRSFGASDKTLESIERLRRGAVAAVTGQQVGFLGGPLFSLLKALTAVRIAAAATSSGVECVPVFWLATEDHDFAEVQQAVVQDADGSLHTVSAVANAPHNAPISQVTLADGIAAEVEQIAGLLGESEVTGFIREAYRPGVKFGDAFARLFAKIFADHGVILMDASDPELHAVAKPVYLDAITQAAALDAALMDRGKELLAAGYHEQVKVTPSSTLLFGMVDGERMPIHRANGQFVLGKEKVSEADLLEQISRRPESFSPNVLLRPIVQDFLLPTLAYTGGPAEVAYFAQAAVVYARLLHRVTPILPRFSATIVDTRAKRFMDKYRLSLKDVFCGPEHMLELMAARSLPADLQTAFERAATLLNQALEGIEPPLQALDPTLVEAANRAGSKMRYQLDRLRKRAGNAELRHSQLISRQSGQLSAALFPHKDLQERVTAGVSFLARYGMPVLNDLYQAALTGCPDHLVVYL